MELHEIYAEPGLHFISSWLFLPTSPSLHTLVSYFSAAEIPMGSIFSHLQWCES